jgi:hypothetical protein
MDDGTTSTTTPTADYAYTPQRSPAFTSWKELPTGSLVSADALALALPYETATGTRLVAATKEATSSGDRTASLGIYGSGMPTYLQAGGYWISASFAQSESLGLIGHPEIVMGTGTYWTSSASPFSTMDGGVGLVADPKTAGWDYQSFGAWDGTSSVGMVGASFGAATPGSAVPTSGTATFTGKLGGLYVSPAGEGSVAAANITVNANFSTRSLGFASSGTTLTRDLKSGTPAPHLNLSGTMTYAPGSGTFSGTLANSGGTMSGATRGQYYGPAAQELGGVFTMKAPTGVEAFAGAYGAKR